MFTKLLIHKCFVNNGETKDKRLFFKLGTSIYDVGRLLSGATSHSEGIIKSFTVTTGVWGSGTAAGYLVLRDCVGSFIDGEAIIDDQPTPGSATADGLLEDNEDEFGYISTTKKEYETVCRFANPSGGLMVIESGEHLVKRYRIVFPPGVTIAEGSLVTGNGSTGYQGTYRVENVDYVYNGHRLQHIAADVKEVV